MIDSDVIMCFFFLLDLVSVSSKLETVSSECVSLQGHCGSVYSTQFSPDSSILLSASEDTSGTKIMVFFLEHSLGCYCLAHLT